MVVEGVHSRNGPRSVLLGSVECLDSLGVVVAVDLVHRVGVLDARKEGLILKTIGLNPSAHGIIIGASLLLPVDIIWSLAIAPMTIS